MFRPIKVIRRNVIIETKLKDFTRTKVIKSPSVLNAAEKLKLYHKENKQLFGPLLDKKKTKKLQSHKSAKNRNPSSDQNKQTVVSSESTQKFSVSDNVRKLCSALSVKGDILSRNMWQNSRNCFNLVGLLLNNASHRGVTTSAACGAARSSPAEPGYATEDKILQIKPHQNDFAKQYPSVTLVLNKTLTEESRAALDKWKKERIAEMGLEAFNKFYEAQLALGTKFHSTLKDYFTQPRSQLRVDKDVEGIWNSVADVLKSISSPKAIESNVVHPVLKYRGIFDAIADYEEKPTLIEWKKSDKARRAISMTYDNPVQLAAYFGAVCNDLNYKHLNVRDALLVIAYTDGSKADVFHLSTDKLREHWAQWLIRLEEYMMKYNNDSEKILKGGKRLFEENTGNM